MFPHAQPKQGQAPRDQLSPRTAAEADSQVQSGLQDLSGLMAETSRLLKAEPDLERQSAILDDAIQKGEGDFHVQRALTHLKDQRDLALSIAEKAQLYEQSEEYALALEQLRILQTVHASYPGLPERVERLELRLGAPQQAQTPAPAASPAPAVLPAPKPKPTGPPPWEVLAKFALAAARGAAAKTAEGTRRLQPHLKKHLAKLGVAGKPIERVPAPLLSLYIIGAGIFVMMLIVAWPQSEPPVAVAIPPVSLVVSPTRAEILVDGQPCGLGSCTLELEPIAHNLTARLAGFRTIRQLIEPRADGSFPAWQANLQPLLTQIELSSDLERATVILDGEEIGQIEDGEFRYSSVALGRHELRVESRGLQAQFEFISQPGQAPALVEPIAARELKVSAAATLAESARIYSNQVNIEVTVDDEPQGAIGDEGLLLAGLGSVRIGEQSFDFQPTESPTFAATITTDRNIGALRIDAGVDDAAIFLNGKRYRRTTSRDGLTLYLSPRTYTVRIEKAGFEPAPEQTADVAKGGRSRLSFELAPEPQAASLAITGSAPGAEVLIDGQPAGVIAADGSLIVNGLEPGQHEVTIRGETHRPRTIKQDLASGGTAEIDGALVSILGTLTIEVEPEGVNANVTVRSDPGGADQPVNAPTLTLKEGDYTVRATAPGYRAFSATVRVEANRSKPVKLQLLKNAAPRAPTALNILTDFADRSGWTQQGETLVRAGGGLVFSPTENSRGVYRLTVQRRRGRLRWVVGYKTQRQHILYQLKKSEIERIAVSGGAKAKAINTPHRLNYDAFVSLQVEVTADAIVHRAYLDDKWIEIDRLEEPGGDFDQGRFAFDLERSRDQIALREFVFQPR